MIPRKFPGFSLSLPHWLGCESSLHALVMRKPLQDKNGASIWHTFEVVFVFFQNGGRIWTHKSRRINGWTTRTSPLLFVFVNTWDTDPSIFGMSSRALSVVWTQEMFAGRAPLEGSKFEFFLWKERLTYGLVHKLVHSCYSCDGVESKCTSVTRVQSTLKPFKISMNVC